MLAVTKETFESEVLKSDKPVLADFNAGWCGPCKAMKPVLEELAAATPGVKFVSIDIDDQDELSDDYDVASIPCLVLFKGGEEVKRHVGLTSRDDIVALISE
ncbi:MAG: thioredoxin [Kiritimatiellae bacterium]|nr:thioredoxin [Kiritimatiellia bacterium]MBR4190432.1 thioredoxin [Kiritimatiellia bacterium]